MIRVSAYEYVLQERARKQEKAQQKKKETHGFQQLLEAETEKLKGETCIREQN